MEFDTIKFEITKGVAVLTLNRPDKLNSFNQAMHRDIREALNVVQDTPTVRALLITGAGRAFCAGQDLSDRMVASGGQPVDLGYSIETYYAPLVRTLRTLPMPVICAVNGVAAGAGANLALACDIVLAARSAYFVEVFCKLGLIPDTGGTWHLPRLVGHARAMGMAMTGEKVMAEVAERWGLIWKCVPDTALAGDAMTLAVQLAAAPTKGLAYTKKAIQASYNNTLPEQLKLEGEMMRELGNSYDYREGVAAFTEKRSPQFKGE